MTLEEQIERLTEVGFVFRDQKLVDQKLAVFEWWNYLDPPFELLLERITDATHSAEELGICDNVYCTDFKHLRHEGWFAKIARWLAIKSGNENRWEIIDVTSSKADNSWSMTYRIGKNRSELVTPYPHKYGWSTFMFQMLPDCASEENCFYVYENPEPRFNRTPLVCWLPRESSVKLAEIFGEKIQMFDREIRGLA